jgi:signal transduction histidine kinase
MRRAATILLVEDDYSMLSGMHDLLEAVDMGYDLQILTANNGQVGLERMAKKTPDLIVSDIMMPQMDGFQFLRRVRENLDWIHIPFIFLTAKGEEREIHQGQTSGANLYIVKPFNSSELLELIESQLNRAFRLQSTHQQHVDSLKKDILQILNHEFRTPLTYVNAYYEMLADGVIQFSVREDFQGYLRGIQAGCIRLTSLVEDLIQVFELRTGEAANNFQLNARAIENAGTLMETAIVNKKAQAEQRSVRLNFQCQPDLPVIYGQPEALTNVFGRLIDNAIKFSHKKDVVPEIRITVSASDDEVFFRVADNGAGFPKRIEDQIFELFFQYNRGLLEQQGAGLGLTIASGIVDLHWGRIQVESKEDVGSVFTIVLPVFSGDPVSLPAALTSEGPRQAIVLVVEDDLHLLDGLRELLEISVGKYSFHVSTAANGKLALDRLAGNEPDLIISDIMMPEMNGIDFLRQVRKNPDWVHIPFIFLSARGEQNQIHDGLRSGAEQYITKPYNSDRLLELVTSQLDRHFQMQGALAQDFNTLKRSILELITPDFRLPLSTVSQYSQKLAQDFKGAQNEGDLKESLQGIQASSVRLTRLVEDFIALAELRTGEAGTAYALNAQPIGDIGLLFCEIGSMCQRLDELQELHFHCTAEANLPLLFGDTGMILSSIQRLVEAGVRHFRPPADSDVYLSASRVEDEVQFSVRFPISADEQIVRRISNILNSDDIDVFESPHDTPGLIIARDHIRLHDGRIRLRHDNHGATFTIILPVYTLPQALQ